MATLTLSVTIRAYKAILSACNGVTAPALLLTACNGSRSPLSWIIYACLTTPSEPSLIPLTTAYDTSP